MSTIITVFCMLGIIKVSADADEIMLKNGDRLTGIVVSMENEQLTFATTYAGTITIKWPEVAQVKTADSIRIVLSDETVLKGDPKSSEAGTMKIKMGKIVETVSFDLSEVAAINPPPKETARAVKVKARVDIGGSMKRGNTEEETIHAATEVVARTVKNRYTIGGEFDRAEKNDEKTDDNSLVYMKYDHFLNHKWFFYNNAFFENDEFKDIKLRTAFGGGLGYQFWETELTNFSVESGVNYISEDYYDNDDDNFFSGRWAVTFDQYLFEKKIEFFHFHEGFIGFENTSDLFIRSRTGLRFPFSKGFTLSTHYNLDWDNDPAPGRDKTDETFLYTIGYEW